MSETTERDAVLKEFHEVHEHEIVPGLRRGGIYLNTDAMANEIVRQRQRADRAERILAALREPSEAVVEAAFTAMLTLQCKTKDLIRAAVEAAEREVDA